MFPRNPNKLQWKVLMQESIPVVEWNKLALQARAILFQAMTNGVPLAADDGYAPLVLSAGSNPAEDMIVVNGAGPEGFESVRLFRGCGAYSLQADMLDRDDAGIVWIEDGKTKAQGEVSAVLEAYVRSFVDTNN